MAAGTTVAVILIWRKDGQRAVRTAGRVAGAIVLYSLVVVIVTLATGVNLFGVRAENSAIYTGNNTELFEGAVRIGPKSTLFCVLVAGFIICSCVAGVRLPWTAGAQAVVAASGLTVGLLSYTRSYLLAMATALAVTVLIAPRKRQSSIRVLSLATVGATASVLVYQMAELFALPLATQLRIVGSSFSGRVLNGLSGSTLAVDTSAQWRVIESALAWQAFLDHPLFGVGFGTHYRPPVPGEPFQGTYGPSYIHDAYLSLLVKGGLLLALVTLIPVGALVVKAATSIHRRRFPLAATALVGLASALAVAMITSPTPFEVHNSLALGCVVAALAICCSKEWGPDSKGELSSPESQGSVT